jgi:hypothetical protein
MTSSIENKGAMKKFIILSFLIIIGRTFDASTTFLYTPDLTNETNVIVKFLGANWTSVIIVQVLLTGLTIGLLYFYLFKFSPIMPTDKTLTLKQFVSHLYYGDTVSFNKIFYKAPSNKQVLLASTGYIVSMTLVSVSYIVGTSTTLLMISDNYKQLYKHGIAYFLYTIIVGLAIWFAIKFFKTEYKKYLIELGQS